MGMNKYITCPECNKTLELIAKVGNPRRLQAFCDCGKGRMRAVYETDDTSYRPATEEFFRPFDELAPDVPAKPTQRKGK